MTLINEHVEHAIYGTGTIMDEKEHKIWINFGEDIGIKTFLYPEAFERFLKPVNGAIEGEILEDLHKRQAELKQQKVEKEQKEAEAKALEVSLDAPKKKTSIAKNKK